MGKTTVVLRIGVLSLQGAFQEHMTQLKTVKGVVPVEVRTVKELEAVDGLVIPGGESTTIALVAQRWGLMEALVEFVRRGKPVWGTCAGLILLAESAEGTKIGGQALIGGLDVVVARNFFGSQVESFETEMPMPDCLQPYGRGPFRGVFIRAPAILETGDDVEILCELRLDHHQRSTVRRERAIVAVRSKTCLATAFHPELTGDNRWHQLFASMVADSKDAASCDVIQSLKTHDNIPSSDLPIYI